MKQIHHDRGARSSRCKFPLSVVQRFWPIALLVLATGDPALGQVRDEAQRLLQERQERDRAEALVQPEAKVRSEPAGVAADGAADPAQVAEDARLSSSTELNS